jgi:hypothetical protein
MELFSIALFVGVVAFPIWGGLVLSNLRKMRKAAESTAEQAAYQSRLMHDRAVVDAS